MTIRRGVDWGTSGHLAVQAPIAADDASANDLLNHGADLPAEIGLLGGDLHRSLGAPASDERSLRDGPAMRFPVDLGQIVLDGSAPRWFLSHVVIGERRGSLWHGPTWIITNGSFVGDLNLGPKAHPNDGRFDVTTGQLGHSQRRRARSRARTGAHLPHPDLVYRRTDRVELLGERLFVEIDGTTRVTARSVVIRCVADAMTVVV